MPISKKRYSREFKIEAVRLLIGRDGDLSQTARELSLNRTLLARWRKEYLVDPEGAFRGSGRRQPEEEAVESLRHEIAELREARAILKKARAYFGEKKP